MCLEDTDLKRRILCRSTYINLVLQEYNPGKGTSDMGIFSTIKQSIGIKKADCSEPEWEDIKFADLPEIIQQMQTQKERYGMWLHTNDPTVFEIIAGTDELRSRVYSQRQDLVPYDGFAYSPAFIDFEYRVAWVVLSGENSYDICHMGMQGEKYAAVYRRRKTDNGNATISYNGLDTPMRIMYDTLKKDNENFFIAAEMGSPMREHQSGTAGIQQR